MVANRSNNLTAEMCKDLLRPGDTLEIKRYAAYCGYDCDSCQGDARFFKSSDDLEALGQDVESHRGDTKLHL